MATGFHLRADERINALRRDCGPAIAVVIAIGRLGSPGRLSQLRCAVGFLVAAVGIWYLRHHHLIVLFSRPVTAAPSSFAVFPGRG